jgi:hypothetical protein
MRSLTRFAPPLTLLLSPLHSFGRAAPFFLAPHSTPPLSPLGSNLTVALGSLGNVTIGFDNITMRGLDTVERFVLLRPGAPAPLANATPHPTPWTDGGASQTFHNSVLMGRLGFDVAAYVFQSVFRNHTVVFIYSCREYPSIIQGARVFLF